VGGGATGTATFRDLSLRGFKTLLLEKNSIGAGTTFNCHQNLVGGMRYAIKDPVTALNCAKENKILSKIAPSCIKGHKNYFVGFKNEYTTKALKSAKNLGIEFREKDLESVKGEIPVLSKDIDIAIETEDKNLDAVQFCSLNCLSAKAEGGVLSDNTEIHKINRGNKSFELLTEKETISTKFIINTTGAWVNSIANKVKVNLPVEYFQGTIIIKKTLSARGIQYFHEPSDADAYIVHGNEAWLGTTSVKIKNPCEIKPEPSVEEYLIKKFRIIIPTLSQDQVIRKFVGIRALCNNNDDENGRGLTRDFKIIENPQGFFHIIGGKLTTARLMAEKMSDLICEESGAKVPCKTHLEALSS
jgi:glycerol-3-phosphate dehydrogenase